MDSPPPSPEKSVERSSLTTPDMIIQGHKYLQRPIDLQFTPPETPQWSDCSPNVSTTYDRFHDYIRAFCEYHPSDEENACVTVTLNVGDVVLIHSVQANGWADGTLLGSGARGWLPTNFCEPYDPDAMRALLQSLTYAYDFLRANASEDIALFARTDHARGFKAGVRAFLDKCGCLSGQSQNVQSHAGIRRLRRKLLSELSGFNKEASALQGKCQREHVLPDGHPQKSDMAKSQMPSAGDGDEGKIGDGDREINYDQILDGLVAKALKVVTVAIRLHDTWRISTKSDGNSARLGTHGNRSGHQIYRRTSEQPLVAPHQHEADNNAGAVAVAGAGQEQEEDGEDAVRLSPMLDDEAGEMWQGEGRRIGRPNLRQPWNGAPPTAKHLGRIMEDEISGPTHAKPEGATCAGAADAHRARAPGSDSSANAGAQFPPPLSGPPHQLRGAASDALGALLPDTGAAIPQGCGLADSALPLVPTWIQENSLPYRDALKAPDRAESADPQPAINPASSLLPSPVPSSSPCPNTSNPYLYYDDPHSCGYNSNNNNCHHRDCSSAATDHTALPVIAIAAASLPSSPRRLLLSDDKVTTDDPSPTSPSFSPSLTSPFTPTLAKQHSRLSSTATVYHRASRVVEAPAFKQDALASQQLCAAESALLSHLARVVDRLNFRGSMDLLVSTHASVDACKSLLNVVEAIWERDSRRSSELDGSRAQMHQRLADLIDATKALVIATGESGTENIFLPQHERRLHETATACVRAAHSCVANGQAVVESTGDFESAPTEAAGLGISEDDDADYKRESSRDSVGSQSAPSSRQGHLSVAWDKPLPTLPTSQMATPVLPRSSSLFPRPPTALSVHSDTRVSFATLRPDAATTRSSSVPRAAFDEPAKHSHKPLPSTDNHLTLDVAIPQTSFIDMAQTPSTPSPDHTQLEVGNDQSFTYSGNPYFMYCRSEASFATQPSTRATTPEHAETGALEPRSQLSFSSASEGLSTSAGDWDSAESQILAQTYAHQLVFNKDGQVTGGSLPALVEKLTAHDQTPDALYVGTFFLTFRLFTTPIEFAATLIQRFDQIDDNPESAHPTRLRVFNVFKQWLECHWRHDVDYVSLRMIAQFARGSLFPFLPSASKRLLELTEQVAEPHPGKPVSALMSPPGRPRTMSNGTRASTEPTNPIISSKQLALLRNSKKEVHPCTVTDFDCMELARQLTMMHSKIFCAIQPEELLGQEWTKREKSKAHNVRAVTALSTKLTNLVQDTILVPDHKKRATVLKQWVKIGEKFLDIGNYEALMAVLTGLNSVAVSRLKKTRDATAHKTIERLGFLNDVISLNRNYSVLRQRVQTRVPPALPFVGLIQTDLLMVDEGNKSTRSLPGGEPGSPRDSVINFDKYVRTTKIVGEVQRFQMPYRYTVVPEMQDWILVQLHRVRDVDATQVFYRRSCALEPKDINTGSVSNKGASPPSTSSSTFPASVSSAGGSGVKEKFDFWHSFHLSSNKDKAQTKH